jgi:hypothetical protein
VVARTVEVKKPVGMASAEKTMKAEQQKSEQTELGTWRVEAIFLKSAVIVLVLTAHAKLISTSVGARALEATDPLLLLKHREVFLSVGRVPELAVAAFSPLALGKV